LEFHLKEVLQSSCLNFTGKEKNGGVIYVLLAGITVLYKFLISYASSVAISHVLNHNSDKVSAEARKVTLATFLMRQYQNSIS
jgi:hypothetical protein